MENPYHVGDVIKYVYSYGYRGLVENFFYYQVVKVTPKCVRLRRLKKHDEMPILDDFDDQNEKGRLYHVDVSILNNKPCVNFGSGGFEGYLYTGTKLRLKLNHHGLTVWSKIKD